MVVETADVVIIVTNTHVFWVRYNRTGVDLWEVDRGNASRKWQVVYKVGDRCLPDARASAIIAGLPTGGGANSTSTSNRSTQLGLCRVVRLTAAVVQDQTLGGLAAPTYLHDLEQVT
jgi:hypothetical protein